MAEQPPPVAVAQPQPQPNQPPQEPPRIQEPTPRPTPAPITHGRRQLPPSFNLKYGRQDVTRFITDHPVNIAAQISLPTLTYRQLTQLSDIDLPLTQDQFTRMWRSIILKRCQDVFEQEKTRRADHFVRLTRNLLLPAPLADLLYALGSYYDPLAGMTYHIVPPTRAADPPNWWTIDNAILREWTNMVTDMMPYFTIKEYPGISDYEGRPIMLTSINDVGLLRTVKLYKSGPRPSDAKIRFVNDEIFNNPHPYNQCRLIATETLNLAAARDEYVSSYCLREPAP